MTVSFRVSQLGKVELNAQIVKTTSGGQETRNQAGGFPIKTTILPRAYQDQLVLGFKSTQAQKPFKCGINTHKPADLEGTQRGELVREDVVLLVCTC